MSIFSEKIVGIDIHDYSIEMVELKASDDKISFEAYNRMLLPVDIIRNGEIKKEDDLKAYILKLLKTANPKSVETKKIALIFPASKVLTHIFSFPDNLKPNEIRRAILLEAETIIPYRLKDVYWDFMILNKNKGQNSMQEVLFAVITKDIADRYSNMFLSIGLKPFLFGINAESLKYALENQVNEEEVTMIIDVESLAVNYLVLKNKEIEHYFSTNEGGKRLFEKISREFNLPEDVLREKKEKNKFENIPKIKQLNEFIEKNYKKATLIIHELAEKKEKLKIDNVILTGGFINLPNFYESAKVYFPNQNIYIGEPKRNIEIKEENFLATEEEEGKAVPYSINFTNVIGITLRGILGEGAFGGINLIPTRLKESFVKKEKDVYMAIASVVMAVISLFIGAFVFYTHQSISFERLTLEKEKEGMERLIFGTRYREIYDQIIAFNEEIDILSKIDKQLFSLPATIEKIQKSIPKSIAVKAMEYVDKDLKISISGVAPTRNALLEMQDSLKGEEFIEDVIIPVSNFDEKSQISFLIQIKLKFDKLPKNGGEK